MAEGAQASRHKRPHKGRAKALCRAANMVVLAEHQAFARRFDIFFGRGMGLVDKVHAYFDAPKAAAAGADSPAFEQARKRLGAAALQMAAWLWLERALREGDIDAATAAKQKKTLHFAVLPPKDAAAETAEAALPAEFRALYAEVSHFIGRIQLMDKETEAFSQGLAARPQNAVGRQWQALAGAFGRPARAKG